MRDTPKYFQQLQKKQKMKPETTIFIEFNPNVNNNDLEQTSRQAIADHERDGNYLLTRFNLSIPSYLFLTIHKKNGLKTNCIQFLKMISIRSFHSKNIEFKKKTEYEENQTGCYSKENS